jgi:hypothetical protein
MGIQESERKWKYRNMKGNTRTCREIGIQKCEKKGEYRNVKGNGNTRT